VLEIDDRGLRRPGHDRHSSAYRRPKAGKGLHKGFLPMAIEPSDAQNAACNPPARLLLQAAHGEMERLANKIDQACHLAGLHGSRIAVMAQSQPERQLMGWAVRVGASFPLSLNFASARVLAAFQRPDRRAELAARMHK
jgi:hypothetical protein